MLDATKEIVIAMIEHNSIRLLDNTDKNIENVKKLFVRFIKNYKTAD